MYITSCYFFILSLQSHLQNDGIKTYAEWQFEKGEQTIQFFLEKTTAHEMFYHKTVLDIGCGAGGKTLYYASKGVKKIYGVDVVEKYQNEAETLAETKGLADKFEFVLGDAANLNFDDNFFDTIIMNDAMEHVAQPLDVLKECYRILKPSGRLYVNFPPYHHPYGAHLSDVIGIPWVHLFFSDKTLIQVYKELAKKHPDGEERIRFRISKDTNGKEYFSYINKMTVKKAANIVKQTGYKIIYYREVPLRQIFKPLIHIPGIKEAFVKMVVYILEK